MYNDTVRAWLRRAEDDSLVQTNSPVNRFPDFIRYTVQQIKFVMIIRLSQKLAKKLKLGTLPSLPSDENPYADWSAHLFTADRTQYIILTNTQSLYSVVMYGKGIADDSRFIGRALDNIPDAVSEALESKLAVRHPPVGYRPNGHDQLDDGAAGRMYRTHQTAS